jgi:hypothetical protein
MLLEEFRADGQAALSTQSDWMLRECDIATSNQNYHFFIKSTVSLLPHDLYLCLNCIGTWLAVLVEFSACSRL